MEEYQQISDRGNKKFVITGLRSIKQKHITEPAYQQIYSAPRLEDNIGKFQKQLDYIMINKATLAQLQNKRKRDIQKKKEDQLLRQVDNLQNALKQLQKPKQPIRKRNNRYPRQFNNHNFYMPSPYFQNHLLQQNPSFHTKSFQGCNQHCHCKSCHYRFCHICQHHNCCSHCNSQNKKPEQNTQKKDSRVKISSPVLQNEKKQTQTSIKNSTESRIKTEKSLKRQNIRRKIKKYFNAVYFIQIVKAYTKKFSESRRKQSKEFEQQRFSKEIDNLKDWLLESHQSFFQIMLQKQQLNFQFFKETRTKVKIQKQKLVMQLILTGLKTMLQKCSIIKLSTFSELMYYLCSCGSFPKSQFWSAFEMSRMCISERYGCMRLDKNLELFFICVMIFMKMLLFNMLLQPHKLDDEAFPKNKQPLTTNLKVIVSVYYYIIKSLLIEYLEEERDKQIYYEGNWLKVEKDFVVTCSQPLVFGEGFPEYDEYISGLYEFDNFKYLATLQTWKRCKEIGKQILKKIHLNMKEKGKTTRRKQQYKFDLEK